MTLLTPRGGLRKPEPGDAWKTYPTAGIARDIGFNAQKFSDLAAFAATGTLSARPASATDDNTLYLATDDRGGTMYWWKGNTWYEIGSRWKRSLTSLTSLPAGYTPTDRDEVMFDFQQGQRPRRWHLVYDGTPVGPLRDNGNRRWTPLGCAPLVATDIANPIVTSQVPNFAVAWTDAVRIPAPGRYLVNWVASFINGSPGSSQAYMDVGIRAWTGSGIPWASEFDNFVRAYMQFAAVSVQTLSEPVVGEVEILALDAGRIDVYAEIANASSLFMRTLRVTLTPLELGA